MPPVSLPFFVRTIQGRWPYRSLRLAGSRHDWRHPCSKCLLDFASTARGGLVGDDGIDGIIVVVVVVVVVVCVVAARRRTHATRRPRAAANSAELLVKRSCGR